MRWTRRIARRPTTPRTPRPSGARSSVAPRAHRPVRPPMRSSREGRRPARASAAMVIGGARRQARTRPPSSRTTRPPERTRDAWMRRLTRTRRQPGGPMPLATAARWLPTRRLRPLPARRARIRAWTRQSAVLMPPTPRPRRRMTHLRTVLSTLPVWRPRTRPPRRGATRRAQVRTPPQAAVVRRLPAIRGPNRPPSARRTRKPLRRRVIQRKQPPLGPIRLRAKAIRTLPRARMTPRRSSRRPRRPVGRARPRIRPWLCGW